MASIHRSSSGSWSVRWREGSRNRSRSFKTKDEARRWQGMVERSEIALPSPGEVPKLADYADAWLAGRTDLAETTAVQYQRWLTFHIYPELGDLRFHELTTPRLVEWQRRRIGEGAGRSVLGKAQTLLSQILDLAVLEGFLAHNPLLSLKRPGYKKQQARWLDAQEVEAIRGYYLDREDVGSAALVSVLAYIGIRPQEALALEWSDLDGDLWVAKKNVQGEILDGSKTGDGHKRFVYVPAPVRADLNTWRDVIPEAKLMFPNRDGQPWTQANYNNWRSRKQEKGGKPAKIKCFKRAALETGIGWNLRPYDLRHTAASLYAAAGWNHLEIADQLGHSPEVSMRVYQHLFRKRRGQEKRSLDEQVAEARKVVRVLFAGDERENSLSPEDFA